MGGGSQKIEENKFLLRLRKGKVSCRKYSGGRGREREKKEEEERIGSSSSQGASTAPSPRPHQPTPESSLPAISDVAACSGPRPSADAQQHHRSPTPPLLSLSCRRSLAAAAGPPQPPSTPLFGARSAAPERWSHPRLVCNLRLSRSRAGTLPSHFRPLLPRLAPQQISSRLLPALFVSCLSQLSSAPVLLPAPSDPVAGASLAEQWPTITLLLHLERRSKEKKKNPIR